MDLEKITTYSTLIFLFFVNLGLGASTTVDDFRSAFRKPKAVIIGFLSQYLFMPIATCVLTFIFQLDTKIAIGVILVGCSPGGATSNLFTYWSRGNVALSITMSFLSTCAAFAMMPVWVLILVKLTLRSNVKVAWENMIITLLLILIPTMIGLYIREKHTKKRLFGKFIWKWIEICASTFGIIFLVATFVLVILTHVDTLFELPLSLWVLSTIVLPLGCIFGYFISMLLGMTPKDRRAISLETGIQNFGLTVAIVQLSFAEDETTLQCAIMFPIIYGFTYLLWSPLITLFFRLYLSPKDDDDDDDQIMIDTKRKSATNTISCDISEGKKAEKTLRDYIQGELLEC